MRTDIYYWKCDKPLSVEEKLVYNDKYRLADVTDIVRAIAEHHFGTTPQQVTATESTGDHYTYLVSFPDRVLFFRADDGKVDDDYFLAEAEAMRLAREADVPVPTLLITDTSKERFPLRYQFMEKVEGRGMNAFYEDKTLDTARVTRQLGEILAHLHHIPLAGFGFFDTSLLQSEKVVRGLDTSNYAYFCKRLDPHLAYLHDTTFLSAPDIATITSLIEQHRDHLNLAQARLVHKDAALWNAVGTSTQINAIVDWDDVIAGDPVDDLAILRCFYTDDIYAQILDGYRAVAPLPDDYEIRLALYVLRNMLWKAMFRSFMGYFTNTEKIALMNRSATKSFEEFTRDRLQWSIAELQRLS